jgi:hypothetical protein
MMYKNRALHLPRYDGNPLVTQLLRRYPKRMWRTGLIFGSGSALVSMLVGVIALFIRHEVGPIRLILALLGFLSLSILPFLAVVAARLTYLELTGQPFQLLYLTTLDNSRIVQGYIFVALFHCRRLLLLILGFTPVLLLGLTYVATFEPFVGCLLSSTQGALGCQTALPRPSVVDLWLADFLLMAINFWTAVLLAATFGVGLAGWWRQAFLTQCTVAICTVLLGFTLTYLPLNSQPAQAILNNLVLFFAGWVLIALIFYIAQSCIRRNR